MGSFEPRPKLRCYLHERIRREQPFQDGHSIVQQYLLQMSGSAMARETPYRS